jgi:16S rRNA (cytosine1402-N4)-methyltransferase
MAEELEHIPVLVEEVIAHFQPEQGDKLLDATLGLGGHALAYLQAVNTSRAPVAASARSWTVVGMDADKTALAAAKSRLRRYGDRIIYIQANYARLQPALIEARLPHAGRKPLFTHILFDLGIGSHQLADIHRGFSFHSTAPLTMKYGRGSYLPPADLEALNMLERRVNAYPDAADIIQGLSADELANVIQTYGEERYSRRIAQAIKAEAIAPARADVLADLIARTVPPSYERGRIHPATRTFQALRLAVNRELESLRAALPQALAVLQPAGRIAVISFHSLEDRIVKQFFRREASDCICDPVQPVCTCQHKTTVEIQTKRPVRAGQAEIAINLRARSAKLRVAMKRQ